MRARVLTVAAILGLLLSAGAQAAQRAADGSIVIDHGDAEYAEGGGAWADAGEGWQERGQSFSRARQTQADAAWAAWKPNLPAAGTYRVYLWNIPFHTQDDQARIEVTYSGGTKTVTRNMGDGYYGWVPLGDFALDAGSAAQVKITRGRRTLTVDAARFRLVSDIVPPAPLEAYPAPDGKLPYLDKPGPAGRLILGGKPYLMLGAELENVSALDPEDVPFMDPLFDILLGQKVNTVEAPISWKQFEPKEGTFDYRVIDALIEKARARNMHLAILWFGTYKNLQSFYSPLWVIRDEKRFFRAADKAGKTIGTISPLCQAALEADGKAYAELLGRIKSKDPDHQVVLMVQVENEMPSWRDYSAPAQAAWNGPVPAELLEFIRRNEATLSPWLKDRWTRGGRKASGTWPEVFGEGEGDGGRAFGTWLYSRFADQVAAAGKQVLTLPMYVNSWRGESPCYYAYMDICRAALPHIDVMGPDLYMKQGFGKELGLTVRPWNNMVVPESNSTTASGARAWTAYGKYDALIFAGYQGPETEWTRCRETFEILSAMAPLVLDLKGTGRMRGFHQEVPRAGESWDETFQGYQIRFTATASVDPDGDRNNITGGEGLGGGLILQMAPDEFVIVASRVTVDWADAAGRTLDVASAEEGHFDRGQWVKDRAAQAEKQGQALRWTFPTESGKYRLVRFKVARQP